MSTRVPYYIVYKRPARIFGGWPTDQTFHFFLSPMTKGLSLTAAVATARAHKHTKKQSIVCTETSDQSVLGWFWALPRNDANFDISIEIDQHLSVWPPGWASLAFTCTWFTSRDLDSKWCKKSHIWWQHFIYFFRAGCRVPQPSYDHKQQRYR